MAAGHVRVFRTDDLRQCIGQLRMVERSFAGAPFHVDDDELLAVVAQIVPVPKPGSPLAANAA